MDAWHPNAAPKAQILLRTKGPSGSYDVCFQLVYGPVHGPRGFGLEVEVRFRMVASPMDSTPLPPLSKPRTSAMVGENVHLLADVDRDLTQNQHPHLQS